MLKEWKPIIMSITEVVVRDEKTIGQLILIAVNLVINNDAISHLTIASMTREELQIFDFMTLFVC